MCWAQDPGDLIELGKTVPRVFVYKDSQTPISVVSEGRHEGEYRDTTPLLQYLWTINDSAKMSSEISCR